MKHKDSLSASAAPSAFHSKLHKTHRSQQTAADAAHPSFDRHCRHVLKNDELDLTGGETETGERRETDGFNKESLL